jgi:hypothetical protein
MRTFNAATQAHHASEFARTEALQQAQVACHNLDVATAAMNQVQHESASSKAQTETLAAQMAILSTEEALPVQASSPSEFATRYNALLGAPVHPHNVRFESRHPSTSTTRQPSPERPRVFSNPFPLPKTTPMPTFSPQMIVIQHSAVELLSHVPTYNGESTAAAISFIGAAENAKQNECETTKRMIVASAARFTGRASQWYETVTTSDLRLNVNSTSSIMLDELPYTVHGWKYFSKLFLEAVTSSTETFDLRVQLKQLVWNPDKEAIKQHILSMTMILHSMALLGDQMTNCDKVEYFMASLVNKSYLAKKINLSHSFDQACRDVN